MTSSSFGDALSLDQALLTAMNIIAMPDPMARDQLEIASFMPEEVTQGMRAYPLAIQHIANCVSSAQSGRGVSPSAPARCRIAQGFP